MDKNANAEDKRVEFRKLIELCTAFREDIDFHEMQDVSMTNPNDETAKLKFQLKTSEDKVQQMLYDEYRQNRHSVLFDQMQEEIVKSRNGNLVGGLLLMKLKQHDLEDIDVIVHSCLKNRAGREMIEEVGKHSPRILRLVEKVVAKSKDFKFINFACYIDGINLNKMAQAVVELNDLDKLHEFGDQHAEDLSARTRKMLSQQFKQLESGQSLQKDDEMQKDRYK